MKLKPIAKNQNELHIESNGYNHIFCFSYDKLVTVIVESKHKTAIYETVIKYSQTTSCHMNQFLKRYQKTDTRILLVEQAKLESMLQINI